MGGSESLVYYSPFLLQKAGIESRSRTFFFTILIGLSKASFIILPFLVADTVGRVPLLLCSTGGMTICLFALSLAASYEFITTQICFMCIFMAFFSIGIGPVTWMICTEV